MISIAFGSLCLLLGIFLIWKLFRNSRPQRRKRRADPKYFKSLEIEAIEEPVNNAWAARAAFQKPSPSPLDFDIEPVADEEIQPTGLSAPLPFDQASIITGKKPLPHKGFGFSERDDDEDGPKQETLGF